jgi:hypothetical protein
VFAQPFAENIAFLPLSPAMLEALTADFFLRTALCLSVCLMLMVLMGFGVPGVLLARRLAQLRANLDALQGAGWQQETLKQTMVQIPMLESRMQNYLAHVHLLPYFPMQSAAPSPILLAPPAAGLLTPEHVIVHPLKARLFQILIRALGFSGIFIGLLAFIQGIYAPQSQALAAPATLALSPLMFSLLSSMQVLVVCFAAAALLWLFVSWVLHACCVQLEALWCVLDRNSQRFDSPAVLVEQLGSLAQEIGRIAQHQSDTTQSVISAATQQFQTQLAQNYGDQLKAIGTTLERVRRMVDLASTQLKNADAAQSKHFALSIEAIHAAAAKQYEQSTAQFNAHAEQALLTLQQAAQMSVTLNTSLVEVFTRDGADIASASRLNRETLERLNNVYEELKLLRAEAAAAPHTKPWRDRMPEPPLANPETTRRLSTAIRNLRQAASEALPEL